MMIFEIIEIKVFRKFPAIRYYEYVDVNQCCVATQIIHTFQLIVKS